MIVEIEAVEIETELINISLFNHKQDKKIRANMFLSESEKYMLFSPVLFHLIFKKLWIYHVLQKMKLKYS